MITLDEKANQRNFMSASVTSWLTISPEDDPELIEAFRTATKPLSAAVPYLVGCYTINPILLLTFENDVSSQFPLLMNSTSYTVNLMTDWNVNA